MVSFAASSGNLIFISKLEILQSHLLPMKFQYISEVSLYFTPTFSNKYSYVIVLVLIPLNGAYTFILYVLPEVEYSYTPSSPKLPEDTFFAFSPSTFTLYKVTSSAELFELFIFFVSISLVTPFLFLYYNM